ncbi:Phosphoglycolate phosphatase [Roseivivax jejudonensis]|uniref:Phosphoglycolate phosphatase n=1 Tax=Roseivivax jejudonensis TaxID=1529041 RepID=A0A1X6ZR90_9RHOB|nr:HAD-IA family hydrolase [Roseivivax jejudonensis]SLN58869.1 Phosphoglycolate phosphatase [Roseivivax jejudonensis]
MSDDLRLVIFDVDGTLVDSQADILAAMDRAFAATDHPVPGRTDILSIVGLSLPEAFEHLLPDAAGPVRARMVDAYKDAYTELRAAGGVALSSPLYPGVRAMLDRLHGVPTTLLGVATGKSRRGLDKLLEGHDLRSLFVTRQCADDHPSKPHPAMLLEALAETGVPPHRAVMVGDTEFDMAMAASAGIPAIGVSWGYHRPERLSAAHAVIDHIDELPARLETIWESA